MGDGKKDWREETFHQKILFGEKYVTSWWEVLVGSLGGRSVVFWWKVVCGKLGYIRVITGCLISTLLNFKFLFTNI